jgi:hypothetical protein
MVRIYTTHTPPRSAGRPGSAADRRGIDSAAEEPCQSVGGFERPASARVSALPAHPVGLGWAGLVSDVSVNGGAALIPSAPPAPLNAR